MAAIEGSIDLAAAGIEQGADQNAGNRYSLGQGFQGTYCYSWYAEPLGQGPGCCQTDAQSGKRAGAGSNGNGINFLSFDTALSKQLVEQGHQPFRVGFPDIQGCFSQQRVIFQEGDTAGKSGGIDTEN